MKSSKISMTDFGRMVTSSVGFKMPNERYESLDSFNGPNVSGNLTIHDLWASNYKADFKKTRLKSLSPTSREKHGNKENLVQN